MKVLFYQRMQVSKTNVSGLISSGEKNCKYFIDYLHDDYRINPLHAMLSQTSTYVRSYDDQTKWIYFFIEDNDLLEKCNTFLYKVITNIKKEFDSRSVYNKKSLKTKIKSYGDKTANFHDK